MDRTRGAPTTLPKVLFVGSTHYDWPLTAGLSRKFEALGQWMDYRVLARGVATAPRFHLVAPGHSFYARLVLAIRREFRQFQPDAVVAEDPRAATLALSVRDVRRRRPRIIAEVHGDWRHATRLYGSPLRRLWSPLTDAVAAYGVRHADAVRVLAGYSSDLVRDVSGREPDAAFPTFSDLAAFAGPVQPLPDDPSALFIGSLEPVKNVDGLARAWRLVCGQTSRGTLTVVGEGSRRTVIERLRDELPGRVRYRPKLSPPEVAKAFDAATVLVLPSRFEGLGRVIIEAFARGRGVVATRAGGVLDLVEDGRQGLLVGVDDDEALADALRRVLGDRTLAVRLGAAARESFPPWNQSADQWASRMRALVDLTLARP